MPGQTSIGNTAVTGEIQAGNLNRTYTYTDLGVLGDGGGGGELSIAYAINRRGQVAGGSTTDLTFTSHAFLWQNGQLNDLGAICPLQFCSSSAFGINNKGEIVGQTHVNFTDPPHAFLYRAGVMTDLGTGYGAGSYSAGFDINQLVKSLEFEALVRRAQPQLSFTKMGLSRTWGPWADIVILDFAPRPKRMQLMTRARLSGALSPRLASRSMLSSGKMES
jgi:probable HAF family extracellular repeat protein